MRVNGYVGEDGHGELVTVDNTRVLAASEAGINVRAIVHEAGDALSADRALRDLSHHPKYVG